MRKALYITLTIFLFAFNLSDVSIYKKQFEYQDTTADYLLRFKLDTSTKEVVMDITSQDRPIYLDSNFTVSIVKDSLNNFILQYQNIRFDTSRSYPVYAYRIRPFVKKSFKINYIKNKEFWDIKNMRAITKLDYFSIDFYYLNNVNKLKYSEQRGGIVISSVDYKRKAERTTVLCQID